jgi:hypothetical protein
MDTRDAVLLLVLLVTGVMGVRGVVAALAGDIGTLARQITVGGLVLAFGVGLYRNWNAVGV